MVSNIPDITATTIYDVLGWKDDFRKHGQTIFNKLQIKRDELYAEIKACHKKDSNYEKLRDRAFLVERLIALPIILEFRKKN